MKFCPKCKAWKLAISEFYRASKRPDGFDPYCKLCHAKKHKDRFGREPETVRAQGRASMARQRAANPDKFSSETDRWNAVAKKKRKAARIAKMGDVEAGERRCSDCEEIKPLDQFAKDKRRSGGVGSYCLACNAIRQAARDATYRDANRVAINERNRTRKATDEFREWEADYRQRPHIKRVRKLRDKVRAHSRRGKGDIIRHDWAAILAAFDGACCYCGSVCEMTVEHLTPLSRGGTNEIGNIAPACADCNLRKRAKTAEEFAPDRASDIRRRAMLVCEPVEMLEAA